MFSSAFYSTILAEMLLGGTYCNDNKQILFHSVNFVNSNPHFKVTIMCNVK